VKFQRNASLSRSTLVNPCSRTDRQVHCPSIVIIEEDDLMRGLLTEWLSAAAMRSSGARLTGRRRPPDLVIVNLYMPRQAGSTSCARCSRRTPASRDRDLGAVPRRSRRLVVGGARSGVRQLIAKPFTRSDLLKAVQAVIGPAR